MSTLLKTAILLSIILVSSCAQETDEESPKKVYVSCSLEEQQANKCTRFMDRVIHLSFSTGSDPSKNNAFQKQEVIDAMEEVARLTQLGSGYFSFKEVDPVLIEPVTEETYADEFRSFIQVWPDLEFNEFADEWGSTPDQNAILVLNKANKRQFYLILRASCFTPNDSRCTNDNGAVMGSNGIRALVARQIGQLVGIPVNCSLGDERAMCSDFPSDSQWTLAQRQYWAANFNNALETISNNPDFYEEFFLEE